MALSEPWHVRSRSRECATTGNPFADGETIVTALFPDPESSGYLRKDISLEAWKNRSPLDPPPFSFWKSTFRPPSSTPSRSDSVDRLSPEDILQQLVADDEPHTENTRYILAVMLERKKILRETDSQITRDGILRVYEHRKNGEIYLIRDPNIPLSQIEQLQLEVFQILENNGKIPPPPSPDPDSSTPSDPAVLASPVPDAVLSPDTPLPPSPNP